MDRRGFLQKSSAAAIAVAGLPLAIRKQQNHPSKYKNELKYGVTEQWYYEIGLFHSTIENFAAAKEEEKVLGLKVNYYNTTDLSKPAQTGEYKYIIRSAEPEDKSSNLWKITTKLDAKVSGDYEFPRNYPKNLSFRCIPFSFVNILGKKDATLASVPYPVQAADPGNNNEDCFLTTACVHHKKLPDDCDELQTLRHLRDDFMMGNKEGELLVNQYAITGPAIVRAINGCINKEVIYDYMHQHMILPAARLVQQHKYEEATMLYKTFVKALSEKYC